MNNAYHATADTRRIRELEDERARRHEDQEFEHKLARKHAARAKQLEGLVVAHTTMRSVTVETMLCVVESGTVRLTASQAKLCLHNLTAVDVDPETGAGVYEIVLPIQFKRDERFAFEGKALMRDKIVY